MALLEYDFRVVGASAIDKAFASIERRAAEHNHRIERALHTPGPSRGKPRMAPGSVDREAKASARTAEREAKAAHRLVETEARRAAAAQVKIERERVREENKIRSYEAAQVRRHVAYLRREQDKAARKVARDRKANREQLFGAASKSVGSSMQTIGTLGVSALTIGGGFAVHGAVSQQMKESALASRLANQAGDPTLKKELLHDAQSVRGFTGEETLSAMGGFVEKTGDLSMARRMIEDLSKLAIATGTDFGELGEAAGQAFNVIRDTVKDPIAQVEMLNDVMRTIAAQGNLGAVEMRDMARELAGLGAATRKFEGGPGELLKTMGAMAQATVARGGAASAPEATTAVTRFAADLTKSPAQKALRSMKVDVFADKSRTQLKDPREIMADILGATGGDLVKLEQVLNAESARAVAGFAPLYLDAEKKARAGGATAKDAEKAGKDALFAEFERFTKAAKTQAEIDAAYQSQMEEAESRWKEAVTNFNREVGSELLPEVTKLVPEIAKLIPVAKEVAKSFAWMVGAFADHPALTIGSLIAAKLTADLASAAIGEAVKGQIMRMLGAAGGAPMVPPGGPGAGSKLAPGLGYAGAIAGTAAVAFGGAYLLSEAYNQSETGQREMTEQARRDQEFYGFGVHAGAVPKEFEENVYDQAGGISAMLGAALAESGTSTPGGPNASPLVDTEHLFGSSKALDSAAEKLDAASTKLSALTIPAAPGGPGPNRGNAPSPVKG